MDDPPRHPNLAIHRRRRILFLDHTAALGGGEIALLNLLIAIRRSYSTQYDLIVGLFSEGPLVHLLIEAGFRIEILPLLPTIVSTRKDSLGGLGLVRAAASFRVLRHVWGLARFIRQGQFDLVHTNSLKSDVIGGLAGRIGGRTVLWHVRDRIAPDYLPRPAVLAFRTLCSVLPNYVIANSQATLDLLRPSFTRVRGKKSAARRLRVVHDGVVESAFVELKPAWSKPVQIGLVGRISPFKGQDIFIRAASMVLQQFPDCHFRIIGAPLFNEEAYACCVRQLAHDLGIADKIEFTGFRSDVMNVIGELDILVHASVTGEPFGQVIVEGMAAGKPVVATRGGGVPEIIEDGTTGLLVPMRDPAAMANALCRLLGNPEEAVQMGLHGRQRVRDRFQIERTAAAVEQFYEQILS